MSTELSFLETLVKQVIAALAIAPSGEAHPPDITMRERFFELLVLSQANLYSKTPLAASMFDRSMLKNVTGGLDDNDAGRFSNKAEDWMRLEGLVRVQEGQKSYSLNRPSLAVLSTATAEGTLGEVMERIAAAYISPGPSLSLRLATRQLGAYFMTRLGRS